MQSKHKGEIVLSLTIGTLIVVGLLTTLSVIGNKLTQKKVITTNASTIDQCDDPNWFCEGICAEPNIRAMFGYDYLKWRGEREKEVGGKCPLTGTTISPTVTPNPNYSSLAQEEYNRCLAMGTPEWFCADECADPINVRNVFKSVYNDKTDAEVATLWRIEKLDNINAGKADADKITCDLINVPTPNYPSSTPRAPSPTPTRISSPTPRASSPTPTKAPSPTPPIAQLCQIRCSNDSFCQANCGVSFYCNIETSSCQIKPSGCTSINGEVYPFNSTICEASITSFMQWECTSSGNKFLKYCNGCSPDRKTCLTSLNECTSPENGIKYPLGSTICEKSGASFMQWECTSNGNKFFTYCDACDRELCVKCESDWLCLGVCADQYTRDVFSNNSKMWKNQGCIIPTRSVITSTPVPTEPPNTPVITSTPVPTKPPNTPTPPIPPTRCNLLMGNGIKTRLDIVILADGYKDMNRFLSDAKEAKLGLQKTNLNSRLLDKMNMWALQDIKQSYIFSNDCTAKGGGKTACINWIKARYDAGKNCGGDIALILRDSELNWGAASVQNQVIFLDRISLDNSPGVGHELGHVIAGLDDEYDYGQNAPVFSKPGVNCSAESSRNPSVPCPKWASRFPNVGCSKVCGYLNWYKSDKTDQTTIMSGGSFKFNEIQLKDGWEPALKNY